MPALTGHGYPEHVRTGEYGPPIYDDTTGRGLIPYVKADYAIREAIVKKTVLQHGERPLRHLFGRLEYEYHATS